MEFTLQYFWRRPLCPKQFVTIFHLACIDFLRHWRTSDIKWPAKPFCIFRRKNGFHLIPQWRSKIKAPFFRMDSLLYNKLENRLIFLSGNLYSLCSPGLSENYSFLIFFIKKARNRQCKSCIFIEINCNY